MSSPDRVSHALHLVTSVDNMRMNGLLCDFKIQVGSLAFNTHRLILAANSGYFSTLFSSNIKEAQDGCITMEDINPIILQQCIEYMYTATYNLNVESVTQLFEGARFLQISRLENICLQFLWDHITPENCVELLCMARNLGRKDLEQMADIVVENNLKIVITSKHFLELPKQNLLRYIEKAKYNTCWLALTIWSSGNGAELLDLVEQSGLLKYPLNFLVDVVLKETLVFESPILKGKVIKEIFSDLSRLKENISCSNCFLLHRLSTDPSSSKIICSFMSRKLSLVYGNPQFCLLSEGDIICIMTSPDLKEEEVKWKGILKWVKSDLSKREVSFPTLFQTIILEKISLEFLQKEIRPEKLVADGHGCMKILLDALFNFLCSENGDTGYPMQKKQPPGGSITRTFDGLLHVCFEAGSFQGVSYPEFTKRYFIGSSIIEEKLMAAFNMRKLFKLTQKAKATPGMIVLHDVPLDENYSPKDVFTNLDYRRKLRQSLDML